MIDVISITGLISFDQCKVRWYREAYQNWNSREPSIAPSIGTALHGGLAGWYKYREPSKALEFYHRAFDRAIAKTIEVYPSWEEGSSEHRLLGERVLTAYFDYDPSETAFGVFHSKIPTIKVGEVEVPWIERRIGAYIRHPVTLYNTKTRISGQMDLVIDRYDGIWVVDHKSYSEAPASKGLDLDEQLTGYAYLFWRATGIVPRGVMLNMLHKKVPEAPKLIEKGKKLSKDKSQPTTFELYKQAIIDNDFDVEDYRDILDHYHQQGWKPFFTRDFATRTEQELHSFEKRLWQRYQYMLKVVEDPGTWLYGSESTWNCGYCPFNVICKSQDEGQDVEDLLRFNFIQAQRF